MLMVSSYMEEQSACLKLEALGHIRVAPAGSPPNCFYSLLEDIFGYKEVQQGTPSLSTPQATPLATAPLPTDPKAFLTTPDIGSGSETFGTCGPWASLPNPYAAGACTIWPGSDQKRWSRTGLAKEFNPKFDDDVYHCPFPCCDYTPRQIIDSMCTHIR